MDIKNKTKNKTVTVLLGDELYDKLEELAKQDERSKSYFIKKALKQYLENSALNHSNK
jgi:predicted transcriptional regulator